jgi:hypothetical protein
MEGVALYKMWYRMWQQYNQTVRDWSGPLWVQAMVLAVLLVLTLPVQHQPCKTSLLTMP